MIPLRLELTNFLSYRETAVLSFNGIHLACISGANGAGKSSILDSITWALFGRSRSKSDDDLVNRLAAVEGKSAEVRFTFELEGNTYRIIRRKKPRRSIVLELQLSTGEDSWKALSESKVRETQAVIEQLLRMNYDTFVNASFLLQGQADTFTTKTPNKRKEILADLLGVTEWERYRETAVNQRKEAENRLLLIEGQLGDIDEELAEEETRQQALQAAQAELAQIAEKRQLKEEILKQLRRAEAAVKQQKETVNQLAMTLTRSERTLGNLRRTQQQRQQEASQHESLLAQAETIVAEFGVWQAAEERVQAWQAKAGTFHHWQQQKRPYELTLAQARSRLEQRQQALLKESGQVKKAEVEKAQVAQQQTSAQTALSQTMAALADLVQQEKAWQEARDVLQQLQAERQLWQQEQKQLSQQAQRVQQLTTEKTAVWQNQQTATATLAQTNSSLAAISQNRERFALARADADTLQAEQERLRTQMDKHKRRLDQLVGEVDGGSCPLCGQTLTTEHRQKVVIELKTDGKEMGDRFRDNKARIAVLKEEAATLETSLKQVGRLERDQKTQQQRLAQAEARLVEVEEAIDSWQAGPVARLAALEQLLANNETLQAQRQKVQALEKAIQTKTNLEKERQKQERQLSQAEARLAEIERLLKQWQTVGQAELTGVMDQLGQEAYEPEARTALAALNAQINELAYDAEAHRMAETEKKQLKLAPARHQALQQAEAALKPLQTTLADLANQLAEQAQTVEDLKQQHETAVTQLETMSAESANLRSVEDEVFQLRETEHEVNRRVGAAQQRLAVLDDLRKQQTKYQKEQAEVQRLIQRIQMIEKAFGRNGVQALLIEQALPEIEDRANTLLDRLTSGEMRVLFETQRQLKSRKATVETLDIRIIDSAGERPYENFSGGEQFRVNFAVRLALSQVLARRAGARLQTLVIDEGFGSQDPNGRQRLVEAINTIQSDFARILIITHIDELRDAFPRRIQVEKNLSGSTIVVV